MNYFNSINFPKSEQKTNKPYKPNTNPEKGGGGTHYLSLCSITFQYHNVENNEIFKLSIPITFLSMTEKHYEDMNCL